MITQGNNEAKTARQLTAKETPLFRENCARRVNQDWADEFLNLYNSADKCESRGDAIIKKLGELHDKQTANELKFLLDHVGNDVRKEFVYNFLTHGDSSGQSCVKVEVKWAGYTDLKMKNSGRIRLYLNKDGSEVLVYFGRRPSIILYLMLLLDAYSPEEASTLDITKRDKQFCKLFYKVFAYDGGQYYFNNLIGKGTSEQKLLRHCLGDIRKNIGETCGLLKEDASPYVLANERSHLNVQKTNIVIDKKLLNIG